MQDARITLEDKLKIVRLGGLWHCTSHLMVENFRCYKVGILTNYGWGLCMREGRYGSKELTQAIPLYMKVKVPKERLL